MKIPRAAAATLIIIIVAAAAILTYQYYAQNASQTTSTAELTTGASLVQTTIEGNATQGNATQGPAQTLVLATTTSTVDSGLLDYLLPIFEKQYNVQVEVLSKGIERGFVSGSVNENGIIEVLEHFGLAG